LFLALTLSSTDLTLYHQLKVLRGTIIHPTHVYIAISGFDCEAAAAELRYFLIIEGC